MPNYVLVINDPNRSVTIHRRLCSSLGSDPLAQTASAERIAFDDGFDALERAAETIPNEWRVCGHCLKSIAVIVARLRKGN